MQFELLGSEAAGPTLRLDHERFAYAGKFVMSSSGKTVAREGGDVVGAVAFSADHDDPRAVHLRYVTVREDRRGEGIGPRLLRFTATLLRGDLPADCATYETVLIAANNPIAYRACYRAGFDYTGDQTGIAELLLAYRPDERHDGRYEAGLRLYAERSLPETQSAALQRFLDDGMPSVVAVPPADDER
jgi:ribosomal protein S18 acetylase RimI-like enzyme